MLDFNLMIHFIPRRGQKRRIQSGSKFLLNVVTVFALVSYQSFLPLTLIQVSADESNNSGIDLSASAATATSAQDDSNSENENGNSNSNKNNNENSTDLSTEFTPSEDGARDDKDACKVKDSELSDYCQEDLKCDSLDKCLTKHACSEIKKCLSVKIENNNKANINDNVSTDANTGQNEITQEGNDSNESVEILNQVQDDNRVGSELPARPAGGNSEPESSAISNEQNAETNSSGQRPELTNENDVAQDDKSNGNEATVDTGNSTAVADVYNEVNTNIVSNNYQETVINIDGTYDGDINLLDQFQTLLEENPVDDNPETGGSLIVNNENDANVTNDIEVSANSGENTIETEGTGDASAVVQTGDAAALSNTVNVVNTNIVGNNVLFAVVNVYGEWNGDLIVPGEGLLEVSPEPVYAETVIVNENEAEVENNATVEADTGNNLIKQEGDDSTAAIVTGAAYAGSEVLNIVNTNVVKNNFFFLLINNLGSWTGKILNWDEESRAYSNIFSYDFGVLGDGETPTIEGILAIFNKNTATVENNVSVSANTGGNTIETEGDGAEAVIQTGNAIAMAKIVNFINMNIVGNNWLFALVNVMGRWNGDAVFAYPDLVVTISDGKDQVGPGETLNYTVSYKNNGKAPCDNANILVTLPSFVTGAGSELNYALSGLKPGEEKSFAISGVVSGDIPEGSTNLEALAGINTGTREVELGNNMGKDETTAYRAVYVPAAVDNANSEDSAGNFLSGSGSKKLASGLTLTREVKDDRLHAGKTVIYNIFLENTGEVALHDVKVFEKMKSKSATVGNFSWNLGDMKPGRKLRIQYKLAINAQAPPGVYRSTASGYGFDEENNKVIANEGGQKITVIGNENDVAYENNYSYGQNLFQYGDSVITGGICFLDEWPALNQVQAAENATFLAGAESNPYLPFWIWLAAAAAAYFLTVNWSLFPKRKLAGILAGGALNRTAQGGAITEMMPAEVGEEIVEEEWPANAYTSADEEEIINEELNENNAYKN